MSNKNRNTPNPIAEVQDLYAVVDQTAHQLSAQRDMLRQQGVDLPPLILDTLAQIRDDIAQLDVTWNKQETELGQLRALADLSAKITTSLDIDTVLSETIDIVITLTHAERGYIILKNIDTQALEFRVSNDSGILGTGTTIGEKPQISMTVVNEVMNTQHALLADNAFKDERLQDNQSIHNFSLRSVLCVPLTYKGDTIGVMYVDNRLQAGIFTQREKALLVAFANTAAVAIANARMYSRTENILAEITHVKELMDNIFSSVGSGIIATNSDDIVETFNRAAGDILSLAPDTVIGYNIERVLHTIAVQLSDYLMTVKAQNTKQTLELTTESPTRGTVALNMTLAPLKDVDDAIQGVTVVMDDVTHLQEHETTIQALRRILSAEVVNNINDIANIQLGGVRREITCLFANVRPLATLKGISPSDKLKIINQYQIITTACIQSLGGIVDKYMGNEVMALFNTQLNPQENHAQMAVECGLMMRDQFVALYDHLGIYPDPHYYSVGLFTGEATLGNVGSFNRREFTAIGNTVNTSKRVLENANLGTITIVQQTLDHIQRVNNGKLAYGFHDRDPIYGKGLSVGMKAYEVYRA